MFADDTEMYKSSDRSSISSPTAMQSCVSDVKDWSLVNWLQLSEDETETILLDPSQSANLPAFLQIGQTFVHFADSARNLGVISDSSLSITEQASKVCRTEYLEIRRIGSIRKYLTIEAIKKN